MARILHATRHPCTRISAEGHGHARSEGPRSLCSPTTPPASAWSMPHPSEESTGRHSHGATAERALLAVACALGGHSNAHVTFTRTVSSEEPARTGTFPL